ncbi:MAG: NnrU family protein [Gammaproteobacteria bacterium]
MLRHLPQPLHARVLEAHIGVEAASDCAVDDGLPFLPLWSPPRWGHVTALGLMPFAFILLAGAYLPSNIKRWTAHPMLWGLVIWTVTHLLANGDLASVILFGGLGALALVMMGSAQVRGATVSGTRQPVTSDIVTIAAGLIAYAIFLAAHPFLFGAAV